MLWGGGGMERGIVEAFDAQLRWKILVSHQKRPEGSWAKVVWVF